MRLAPDAVATVCGALRWSYGELNRRANRMARRLRESGAGPETRIGLLLAGLKWLRQRSLRLDSMCPSSGAAGQGADDAYPPAGQGRRGERPISG